MGLNAEGHRREWVTWLGVVTAVIAAVGALIFNAVSVTATNKQIELSREGHLTDRYSKAVEQLGNGSPDVRLGGIYALERLMRDSPSDQPTIVEVLAAFIRDHVSKRPAPTSAPSPPASRNAVFRQRPTDLLAALTVLGRRNPRNNGATNTVDLTFTNLAGLNLSRVKMAGANLNGAQLQGTLLTSADLTNASLGAADLTDAYLSSANLTCSSFFGANLTRAVLSDAILARAGFHHANLRGASLARANVTGASFDDGALTVTTGTPARSQSTGNEPRCESG